MKSLVPALLLVLGHAPRPAAAETLAAEGVFALPIPSLLEMSAAPRSVKGVAQDAGIVDSRGRAVGLADFAAALSASDIVLAGEQHDQASHHLVQLDVIKAVHARRGHVVIGLEMFDRTQQGALDDFLAGFTGEAEFAALFEKVWGFDYALYKPIFDYARANHLPMRALNAPRSVVSQVAKGGLASLSERQRALIAERVSPITDPRYLEFVKASMGGHGSADPARMARMIEAQAVWNETMAESALFALPDGPMVILAGVGHMVFRAGIGESLRSRSRASYSVVLPWPAADRGELKPGSEALEGADFFRLY